MHFVSYSELNPHKYCGNMFSNDKYANNLIIAFSAAYISMDFHFLGRPILLRCARILRVWLPSTHAFT